MAIKCKLGSLFGFHQHAPVGSGFHSGQLFVELLPGHTSSTEIVPLYQRWQGIQWLNSSAKYRYPTQHAQVAGGVGDLWTSLPGLPDSRSREKPFVLCHCQGEAVRALRPSFGFQASSWPKTVFGIKIVFDSAPLVCVLPGGGKKNLSSCARRWPSSTKRMWKNILEFCRRTWERRRAMMRSISTIIIIFLWPGAWQRKVHNSRPDWINYPGLASWHYWVEYGPAPCQRWDQWPYPR